MIIHRYQSTSKGIMRVIYKTHSQLLRPERPSGCDGLVLFDQRGKARFYLESSYVGTELRFLNKLGLSKARTQEID